MRKAATRQAWFPVLAWPIFWAAPLLAAQEPDAPSRALFLRGRFPDSTGSLLDEPSFEALEASSSCRSGSWTIRTAAVPSSDETIYRISAARGNSDQEGPQAKEEALTPHGSFTGFFDQHGSSKAWKEYVWEDELTQPAVLLPLVLAVAAAVIYPWDKRLEQQWHGLLGGHQTYSNVGQDVLIVTAVLSGALFPGEGRNTWDEIWTQGEAFLASSLTVATLKTLVARPRPGATPGTGNGSGSFPSGHSAAAFTSATLIERNSGLLAGLPAYGLAAFTAFERVEAGRHYPSDVLAGAAIGCLSAGIMDSLHWGSGPGRGIARTAPNLTIGFVDRLHGISLDWEIPF